MAGRFSIKMLFFFKYWDYYYKARRVSRPSYRYKWNPYTSKDGRYTKTGPREMGWIYCHLLTRSMIISSQSVFSAIPRLIIPCNTHVIHDDVIKWKHFPRYWPFVRGLHRSQRILPRKGQWRGALMFSLICSWTNGWRHRDAGDFRRHRDHYDVTVMHFELIETEWRISTSANKVIICSDAGLLVAFIWTNAGWSSTRPIATN